MIIFLILTILLAGVFLGVKYFEYSHKFHEGLLPGKFYTHQGDTVPGQFLFFSFYFMMTGLHGIHVLVGMVAHQLDLASVPSVATSTPATTPPST